MAVYARDFGRLNRISSALPFSLGAALAELITLRDPPGRGSPWPGIPPCPDAPALGGSSPLLGEGESLPADVAEPVIYAPPGPGGKPPGGLDLPGPRLKLPAAYLPSQVPK